MNWGQVFKIRSWMGQTFKRRKLPLARDRDRNRSTRSRLATFGELKRLMNLEDLSPNQTR